MAMKSLPAGTFVCPRVVAPADERALDGAAQVGEEIRQLTALTARRCDKWIDTLS